MVEHPISLPTKIIMGGCIMALQSIGSDAMPLFFSLFGAGLGMSFTEATSRLRMAWQVTAVSIVCTLFGSLLGQIYFDNHLLARCACACFLAMVFHPALNLIVGRLPRLFDMAEEGLRILLRLPPKKDAP